MGILGLLASISPNGFNITFSSVPSRCWHEVSIYGEILAAMVHALFESSTRVERQKQIFNNASLKRIRQLAIVLGRPSSMNHCAFCGQGRHQTTDLIIDVWPAGLTGILARLRARKLTKIKRAIAKIVISVTKICSIVAFLSVIAAILVVSGG